MRPALHTAAFLLALALWTWKLLESHPVPDAVAAGLGSEVKFSLAKSLHLGGYAFLAVLGGSISGRWRGAIFAVLMLHGIATEIGQTFVPNRSGTILDVLIDWCGIGLGAWLLQRWTRRQERRISA